MPSRVDRCSPADSTVGRRKTPVTSGSIYAVTPPKNWARAGQRGTSTDRTDATALLLQARPNFGAVRADVEEEPPWQSKRTTIA